MAEIRDMAAVEKSRRWRVFRKVSERRNASNSIQPRDRSNTMQIECGLSQTVARGFADQPGLIRGHSQHRALRARLRRELERIRAIGRMSLAIVMHCSRRVMSMG